MLKLNLFKNSKKNTSPSAKLTLVKDSNIKKGKKSDISSINNPQPFDFKKIAISLIVVLFLTFLISPDVKTPTFDFKIGDIASKDIKSTDDFLIKDKISTKKNIINAIESQVDIYDFDQKVAQIVKDNINNAFSLLNNAFTSNIPGFSYSEIMEEIDLETEEENKENLKSKNQKLKNNIIEFKTSESFYEKEIEFINILGVELTDKSLKTLRWHNYKPDIKNILITVINLTMEKGLVNDSKRLTDYKKRTIISRSLDLNKETIIDKYAILSIDQAKKILTNLVNANIAKQHPSLKRALIDISMSIIVPNLTFNQKETKEAKTKAEKSVKDVFFQIKEGEMVVREGERITQEHLLKLEGMTSEKGNNRTYTAPLGISLFIILIATLVWHYLNKFKRDIALDNKKLLLICTILILNFTVVKMFIFVSQAISDHMGIAINSFYYSLPYAAGSMLVAILFEIDISIIFSLLTFFLVGLLMEGNSSYALVALTGSLTAALRVNMYKHRSSILYTGIIIGFVNVFTILSYDLLNNSIFTINGAYDLAMGFVGGLITAVFASVTLPILEPLFEVTSDIRLLELADPSHPLLTQMVIHAPGTYQHSHLVANLSEEAAESVNAHPLLVRVGSYYHDIGKMKKADYFIENQQIASNSKHDKLTPSMSSLVLLSHVKDGVELAKEYKLIPDIIKFIKEHHGNSLISYFYNKAKEQQDENTNIVKEDDFRYPGPRPRSKEVAIVMLADSVEAASRTLDEPTPSRLKGLVHSIINSKFIDGQLDECDLSLKDLSKIEDSFTRILLGIFHYRVDYPVKEEKTKKDESNRDYGEKQPAKSEVKYSRDKKKL